MQNRTETTNFDTQIGHARQEARDAEVFGFPVTRLCIGTYSLGMLAAMTSNVALLVAMPLAVTSLIGGGFYGSAYYYRTMEKRLIVQRLIEEINAAPDMPTLLKQAEDINQNHSPYLRTERGFYGFTLVQKWVGDRYGHMNGNTKSWQDVSAALEAKCKTLAEGNVEEALAHLHEKLSLREIDLPPPRPGQ